MTKSTLNPTKKKMGRPKVDSEQINIRLHSEIISQLDTYRNEQEDLPGRPEAIRRILQDWLEAHNYISTEDGLEHEE